MSERPERLIAVAMNYQEGSPEAPRVTAKGFGLMAERIVALAEEHDVMVDSNPVLARALAGIELDQAIPIELFEAAAGRARLFGYRIDFFAVDPQDHAALRRTARVWRARGIRGVLVGPLNQGLADPPLPWADFSWVTIGQSLISPPLHRVGRDYDKDIDLALARLHAAGCRRPGFVDDPAVHHLMMTFDV